MCGAAVEGALLDFPFGEAGHWVLWAWNRGRLAYQSPLLSVFLPAHGFLVAFIPRY